MVARWLERRQALGLTGRQPLFCTLEGRQLKSSYVRTLLPRLVRKAGLEKRVHPHGLRHTHAAELAGEGKLIGLGRSQYQARRVAEFTVMVEEADVRSRYDDALEDYNALKARFPGEVATNRSNRGQPMHA